MESKLNKNGFVFLGDSFFYSPSGINKDIYNFSFGNRASVVNCETVFVHNCTRKMLHNNKLIPIYRDAASLNTDAIEKTDIFSIANNHTSDLGQEGLTNTVKYLKDRGKVVIGTKHNSHTILHMSGKKICLFSCVDFPGWKYNAYPKGQSSLRVISRLRSICDYLVVFIHWGIEYADFPSPKQRKLARMMITGGADLIIGHHPHVFQGMEEIQGKRVYYSIGNANFGSWQNKYSCWSNVSLIVDVKFSEKHPVIKEYFHLITDDYTLLKKDSVFERKSRKRFEKISKEMKSSWIDWGMKTAPIFWQQEKEAFMVRFRRRELKQFLIFIYWLVQPKTIFFLFCLSINMAFFQSTKEN